ATSAPRDRHLVADLVVTGISSPTRTGGGPRTGAPACAAASPRRDSDSQAWAGSCRSALDLLDLREIELDRRRTAEDRHRHAHLRLVVVHVFHVAVEVGERTFLDAHGLA